MGEDAARAYARAAREVLDRVVETQLEAVETAAHRCAATILADGLVHLFGSGHSRMAVEEVWPRYGSFPGFHPIVELSLTFHTQVTGANGQRQAMFIENAPGLAERILRNFAFGPDDVMIVFSTSGTSVVPVEIASGSRARGMYTIGVTSVAHCQAAKAKQPDGLKLIDAVDLVLDNCAIPGDAMVDVPDLPWPVGPGSTIGNTVLVNALKCRVAELLTAAGQPPLVLTSSLRAGEAESARLFDLAYDEHRRRVRRL